MKTSIGSWPIAPVVAPERGLVYIVRTPMPRPKRTRSTPDGWHAVTPRLFVDDPRRLVTFLRETFAATGAYRATSPSEITIGDSIVMVSGTDARPPMPACLYVYVDDADRVYRRALAAGAESVEPPADMPYGDRRAMVKDAWGNVWQIATFDRRPRR